MPGKMNFAFDLHVSSRAVDEDDEYDEEDEQQDERNRVLVVRWSPKVRLEMSSSAGIGCASLLVAIGSTAAGFIELHLLKSQAFQIIGAVCLGIEDPNVNSFSQEAPNDQTCFIYRLLDHPDVVVIQCKVNISPEQLFSFSEQVLSKLCESSTTVTVLSSSSTCMMNYKCASMSTELPSTFVRCLKSNRCSEPFIFPPLEQPSIVSGLSAQILTHCQSHRLSCVVYLCFADTHCLQSEAIEAFQGVQSCSTLKNILHPNISDQELRNFCEAQDDYNMLYS